MNQHINPEVSIVIPVYNSEQYLHRCLDTVCAQTFSDLEIICVDDGSTDTSLQILEEYAEKDGRFIIYHQENKYAGAARNVGLEHANGTYVIFWDSDDFFHRDAIEKMLIKIKAEDADICVCGVEQVFPDKKGGFPADWYLNMKRIPEGQGSFNRTSNDQYILNFTSLVPWNKLFRRAFLEKHKLRFKEIRFSNDTYFTIMAICLAEKITVCKTILITYRRGLDTSLTGKVSMAPLVPVKTWMDAADDLQKMQIFPEQSFANKIWDSYLYVFRNTTDIEAFTTLYNYFKEEAAERLHIKDQPDGYYYNKWQHKVLRALLSMDVMQFYAFLARESYFQQMKANAESAKRKKEIDKLKKQVSELLNQQENLAHQNKNLSVQVDELLLQREQEQKKYNTLKKKNEELQQSWSYRIGHMLIYIPGIMKKAMKK